MQLRTSAAQTREVRCLKTARAQELINNEVVLILGAGASQPYNFPAGEELVEVLKAMTREDCERFFKASDGKFSADDVQSFRQQLTDSRRSSIDRLLQHRSDLETLGKALIAYHLLQREDPNALAAPGQQKVVWIFV